MRFFVVYLFIDIIIILLFYYLLLLFKGFEFYFLTEGLLVLLEFGCNMEAGRVYIGVGMGLT